MLHNMYSTKYSRRNVIELFFMGLYPHCSFFTEFISAGLVFSDEVLLFFSHIYHHKYLRLFETNFYCELLCSRWKISTFSIQEPLCWKRTELETMKISPLYSWSASNVSNHFEIDLIIILVASYTCLQPYKA